MSLQNWHTFLSFRYGWSNPMPLYACNDLGIIKDIWLHRTALQWCFTAVSWHQREPSKAQIWRHRHSAFVNNETAVEKKNATPTIPATLRKEAISEVDQGGKGAAYIEKLLRMCWAGQVAWRVPPQVQCHTHACKTNAKDFSATTRSQWRPWSKQSCCLTRAATRLVGKVWQLCGRRFDCSARHEPAEEAKQVRKEEVHQGSKDDSGSRGCTIKKKIRKRKTRRSNTLTGTRKAWIVEMQASENLHACLGKSLIHSQHSYAHPWT